MPSTAKGGGSRPGLVERAREATADRRKEGLTRCISRAAFGGFGSSAAGYILPFLFVLTIVVFFHELGHFLVARWCGVTVKVFSVGFGPELFGFTDRKGTRWQLSLIPLGGYVKFLGDENEASVTDREALASDDARRNGAATFAGKSVAARAAIVAAGPIANFILAIVIFTAIFSILSATQDHARAAGRLRRRRRTAPAEKGRLQARRHDRGDRRQRRSMRPSPTSQRIVRISAGTRAAQSPSVAAEPDEVDARPVDAGTEAEISATASATSTATACSASPARQGLRAR